MLQFEEVIGADLNEVVDEHFLETLKTKLTENFGELKFIKFINEMIWVAFNNYEKAIDASEQGSLEICGHNMTIRLRNLAWRQTLGKVAHFFYYFYKKSVSTCYVQSSHICTNTARTSHDYVL